MILIGFGTVCINHTFHHAWPDSEKDPHSPIGKSFGSYFLTCLHSGVEVIKKGYFHYHGRNERTERLFKQSVLLHFLAL